MKKLEIIVIAAVISLAIFAFASMQAKADSPTISFSEYWGCFADTVTVSGSGFASSSIISATFDGSPLALIGTTTTDSSGSFSAASFTVPASTDGNHLLIVTDSSSGSCSATFTITPSGSQYQVTFAQAGLNADASGNLVSFTVLVKLVQLTFLVGTF